MVMEAVVRSKARQPHTTVAKLFFFAIPLVIGLVTGLLFDPASSSEHIPQLSLLLFIVSLASYQLIASNRPLLYTITISRDYLEVKAPFWGKKSTYRMAEMEGFKKQLIPAGSKAHANLLLYAGGKKIVEVSSRYITNTEQIEVALQDRVSFLGNESFSLLKNLWSRMLWR